MVWIYGLFGYLVNFKLVPNEMGFHTIKFFGYMVYISDIWSIFEYVEASFEVVDALGD